MGIVVQKFGGTSVADAKSCALVVSRIVEARRAGNDVVAVVSAMGRKPAPTRQTPFWRWQNPRETPSRSGRRMQ